MMLWLIWSHRLLKVSLLFFFFSSSIWVSSIPCLLDYWSIFLLYLVCCGNIPSIPLGVTGFPTVVTLGVSKNEPKRRAMTTTKTNHVADSDALRRSLFTSLICRWCDWDSERLSNPSKTTQLIHGYNRLDLRPNTILHSSPLGPICQTWGPFSHSGGLSLRYQYVSLSQSHSGPKDLQRTSSINR